MKVTPITVGPLGENAYLLVDDAAGKAVFVDPGDEPGTLLAALDASGASLEAIWLTHAHMDHVGAVAGIRRAHRVPVYLHPLDRPMYDRAEQIAATWGLTIEAPPPPDRELADGDTLTCGTLRFEVMHVPGHAPGHVVIHGNGIAFVGDLVFAGSIGRTDLPLSNPREMSRSLHRLTAGLPPDTVLLPGHGPVTRLDTEARSNPFLTGSARVSGA